MPSLKGINPQPTPTPITLGLLSLNGIFGGSKNISAKPQGKAATPSGSPLPSPTNELLNAIIANSRSTFQATKQIISSASSQAAADRASGRSLLSGVHSYTRAVNDLTGAITQDANLRGYSHTQRQQLTAEQLGEIAQTYSYLSVRDSLTDGASAAYGVKKDSLASRSTLDLLFDNLGLTGGQAATTSPITSGQSGYIISHGTVPSSAGASGSVATGLAEGASLSSQVLGALGAAYSAFQVFNNWGKSDPISGAVNGFTAGAYIGGMIGGGPFGAAVGGAIGGVVGLVSGFFKKSGKSQDQVARDQVRSMMIEGGMINDSWQLTLADGSLYDIGKDGKFKLTNTDGTTRRAYEVDFKNPLAEQTVAMLQPLAFLITGGNQKLANDFTGYFVNAALSNAKTIADVKKNAVAIFSSAQMEPQKIAEAIVALVQRGSISEERGKAYVSGLALLHESTKVTSTDKKAESETKAKKAA